MGVYNTYGNVQLKVGADLECRDIKIGEDAGISDGIYVGYEGFVIVLNGKFVAEFSHALDKWGGFITPKEMMDSRNPIHPKNLGINP